ncbi:hypothetical protein GGI23_000359 [Coemansia sp. RSA 2559]|nr:hypothetical protein GGI23_000359 [Coemansia sp. RSA 2559]KAJ2869030.1 hypothetical protein GGI22_000512 [Coemansia erecta]
MVAHHQPYSSYEHSYHQRAPLSTAPSAGAAKAATGSGGYRFHSQHHRSPGPSYHPYHCSPGPSYHPYQRNMPAPEQFRRYEQPQSPPLFHHASTTPPLPEYRNNASGGAVSFIVSSSSMSPPPSSSLGSAALPLKGKRKRASPQQLDTLNKVFASTSFPSTEMRNRLARDLGMTPRTVQIWFQNKRQASRQRDGHHSRNTKSLAVYASSDSSIGASQDTVVSSAAVGSPATSRLYMYGNPHYQHSKSTSPHLSDYHHGNNRPQTMVASPSPAQSMPSPATSYSSAYTHTPSATQKTQGARQQLMVLVEAATTAAHTSDAAPESQQANYNAKSEAAPSRGQPTPASSSHYHSKGDRSQYAHTRNDMWFSNAPPPRLDYLYDSNNSVAPKTHYHSQPVSRPTPVQQQQAVVPANRSMSLMALLNAPPEQRKLPPLPSMAAP